MKYEVKGLFSYGVYDGDRLLGTYESEKSATLVCDALNDEAARVLVDPAVGQSVVNPARDADIEALQGLGWAVEERQQVVGAGQFPPITGDGNASAFTNGQDKETT